MKKIFIILVSAFAFSAAMPVYAETVNNQVVAVQQDDEPVTREILVGNWDVQGEEMQTTFSFNSNGKLLVNMSQTSKEEGIEITVRIDIKNIDWNVELGKLILKFDKAEINVDLDLPPMLAGYKDMLLSEFDSQKQEILDEMKKLGETPIEVEMLDQDTLRVALTNEEDEEPNILVRIKD